MFGAPLPSRFRSHTWLCPPPTSHALLGTTQTGAKTRNNLFCLPLPFKVSRPCVLTKAEEEEEEEEKSAFLRLTWSVRVVAVVPRVTKAPEGKERDSTLGTTR